MKVAMSIALPADTIKALDEASLTSSASDDQEFNRSRIIEQAIHEYLERRRKSRQRKERDARDLEILNSRADELNQEIEDVLAYQVDL